MPTRWTSADPALSRLVEKQLRNWEIGRTQRLTVPAARRREVEDFVCVSRIAGVDDRQVAVLLAERLGWPLFGRELLEAMAGDDRQRRQLYASMDERDLGWFEQTMGVLMGRFVRNDYFHRLCETVLSLARQGSCVFLGRGVDLMLPGDRGFRVGLLAPLEQRIRACAEERGVNAAAARREVERLDQDRREFFRHHFHRDANDPLRHDLIVNLGRFTAAEAVELILQARRARLARA